MKNFKLTALSEGAIMVALAQILGYIKLFSLPNGGSITLNMLPIFLYAIRWGVGYGLISGFSLGLLQLLLDGAFAWGWQSIFGDYLIAYSMLGLAGLFKGKNNALIKGIITGSFARFIIAWFVGAVVWGMYMPDIYFGMKMTSPWIYSLIYNGIYIFSSMILCLIIGAILNKELKDKIYYKTNVGT